VEFAHFESPEGRKQNSPGLFSSPFGRLKQARDNVQTPGAGGSVAGRGLGG
jgi:hypothetical protein